jgi:hypothetical protein
VTTFRCWSPGLDVGTLPPSHRPSKKASAQATPTCWDT